MAKFVGLETNVENLEREPCIRCQLLKQNISISPQLLTQSSKIMSYLTSTQQGMTHSPLPLPATVMVML